MNMDFGDFFGSSRHFYDTPLPRDPTIDLQIATWSQHYETEKRERDTAVLAALAELDLQIATYQIEIELLAARTQANRRTSWQTWLALGVLFYITVTGILVPLLLMPASPEEPLSQVERWGVVSLFMIGLFVFVMLIVAQLLRLRRP